MRQATLLRVAHKGFIFLPICWRFHPRYCSHQDVRSGCSCLQSCEDFGPAARAGDALRPLCKAAKPRAPCKGWPHATNSSLFRAIPRGDPLLSIPGARQLPSLRARLGSSPEEAPGVGTKLLDHLFPIAALLTPHQLCPRVFHLSSLSGALTEISW